MTFAEGSQGLTETFLLVANPSAGAVSSCKRYAVIAQSAPGQNLNLVADQSVYWTVGGFALAAGTTALGQPLP